MASLFSGHNNNGAQVGENSGTITQTIHIHNQQTASVPQDYRLRLSLGAAPQIDYDNFVGRETEIAQLEEWLSHTPATQKVVAICGLGGVGKTQLSIHFARRCQHRFSSIIWFNAKDETTLKAGFVALASRILDQVEHEAVGSKKDEDVAVQYIREWLSKSVNQEWLLILDNYDDPRLPGIESSSGYDIRHFFPHVAQGSILITTRSSRLRFGKQMRLCKLEDVHQSLAILTKQSGLDAAGDTDAHKLANRLDGLPLALTTAGVYISQTGESFGGYLQMYEKSWHDLAQHSDELLDYEDRTLYSTWNLSSKQVEAQDPEASQLLRFMAYLSNVDIWFELFQSSVGSRPIWLSTLMESKTRFNKAMSKLQEYSLVEVSDGSESRSYSIHNCVHDWALEFLNGEIDGRLCALAASCIAGNVKSKSEPEFWLVNRRLIQHVSRLEYERIARSIIWSCVDVDDIFSIAYLNSTTDRIAEAEAMYRRALRGYEKAWGPEHPSTLDTVNNLGNLYLGQGQMAEAEAMYQRALDGKEKAWGPEHTSTLGAVNNLGLLYNVRGRMAEAEVMYQRALGGYEKVWGPEHTSTLNTVNNLGNLYANQGQMVEAEAMYQRALDGYEKAWGPEHTSTLDIVNNLGLLYKDQGRMTKAEAMYQRALDGCEKAWGPEHTSTLNIVNHLGNLYADQGRIVEAEAIYQRALDGYEKARGPEHTSTLDIVNNLGNLYIDQGRIVEAEAMYRRALSGYEKAWGPEHPSTLDVVNNLGALYSDQGRIIEAEAMYQRALDGYEKVWGPEHSSTLNTVNNLGNLYADQDRIVEAEAMYQRALDGYEKVWGPEHSSTLNTVNNLGNLYADQDRIVEAEAMYQRALDGKEKVWGPEHTLTLSTVNTLGNLYKAQGRIAEAEAMYQRASRAEL